MAQARTIGVSSMLDDAGVNSFTLRVLIVATLIIFIDGFDVNNIGFAAPALKQAWQIQDMSIFGPVFGASFIGIFIGAPFFGFVGDRFGRKKAVVSACLVFAIFTFAAVLTSSIPQLIVTRILCGIGIGGVMPNLVALVAEFAPRRSRSTLVVLMFSGIGLGAGLPGPLSAWLVPLYGWQVLFTVGGSLGLIAALLALFAMPESIKYLALTTSRKAEAIDFIGRLRPDLSIAPDAQLVIEDESQYSGFSPKYLFRDGYAALTITLWILFVMNLMGYFFIINWTPILLGAAHVPPDKAALVTASFQLGGVIGGWVVCRPIDKVGFMPVGILALVAIPLVAVIGYVGATGNVLLLSGLLFFAGFCVLGMQYAINAISGIIYPTAIRSNGSGWAFAVGRVGSIGGPVIGGWLIAMHFSVEQLYLWSALPFLIGAPVCFLFARHYNERFYISPSLQRGQAEALVAPRP